MPFLYNDKLLNIVILVLTTYIQVELSFYFSTLLFSLVESTLFLRLSTFLSLINGNLVFYLLLLLLLLLIFNWATTL